MSTMDDLEWMTGAPCTMVDPDDLFLEGAAQSRGRRVCAPCTAKAECLAYALDRGIDNGVWGGLTERERRELVRKHPHVTNWKRAIMKSVTAS